MIYLSKVFIKSIVLFVFLWYRTDAAPSLPVRAAVVCACPQAAEVGVNIMKQGGNAVDAAVAVGFALAVVYPEAGNIGGGGYMLISFSNDESVVIDFRERAPYAATRTMYLDSSGNVTNQSLLGHRSVAVPGTVAGLVKALEKYGTKSLHDIIQPAVDLAEQGFVVDQKLAARLKECREELLLFPSTVEIYTRNDSLLKEGDTLRIPDLAATLRRIQQNGHQGFYGGETARLIVEDMRQNGGLITQKDLADYEAIIREPLKTRYRGYEILSVPPSSSGGLCLFGLLQIVEGFDLSAMGFHSVRSVHVITEAMKRVYADRAEVMGDPAFTDVPIDLLTSKEYAERRRKEIDTASATPASLVRAGTVSFKEDRHTTHYVVADQLGNVVSVTYTINDLFGSKAVVKGAGFFLNDEMDDFSAKPGVPNAYGLIGGEANAIEPGKRPLSSMTPTIVLKDGKPFMALGARGGSKIITAVFQTIINVIDYGMNVQQAVDAPRFHHQWLPDELVYEQHAFSDEVVQNLQSKGHTLRRTQHSLGELQALWIDSGTGFMYGAPDKREGGVAIGY